jgi:hypothetical protein
VTSKTLDLFADLLPPPKPREPTACGVCVHFGPCALDGRQFHSGYRSLCLDYKRRKGAKDAPEDAA